MTNCAVPGYGQGQGYAQGQGYGPGYAPGQGYGQGYAQGQGGYACQSVTGCAVPGYGQGQGYGYGPGTGCQPGTYGCFAVPGYGATPGYAPAPAYGNAPGYSYAPLPAPAGGVYVAPGNTAAGNAYANGVEGGGHYAGNGYGATVVGGGYQGGAAVILGRGPQPAPMPVAPAPRPVAPSVATPAPQQGPSYAPGKITTGLDCHFIDATVVKTIHAICVASDGHQFPASHMTGDTWINSGYEGEVARCLPGTKLTAVIGSVTQNGQEMMTSLANAQTLQCGTGEALRHYKNGMLKCAPAVRVPDCTERTNLRKYGSGDMFFTYVAKVCQETGKEFIGGQSRQSALTTGNRVASASGSFSASSSSAASSSASDSRFLTLRGMVMTGGVGDRY